jgi:hypothetical protein
MLLGKLQFGQQHGYRGVCNESKTTRLRTERRSLSAIPQLTGQTGATGDTSGDGRGEVGTFSEAIAARNGGGQDALAISE